MRKYRNYTDKDIIESVNKVTSLTGLLIALGLKPAGGNFINMKRNLSRLRIDTSHWKGSAWSKGEQLKDYSQYTKAHRIKPHLIKKRGHKCEECKLEKWKDSPIPLELHHIDGNRTHNEDGNLQLLCPNCHALTSNWRNRKR